jgi:alkanesulfonate monooxygenase SsuD/methylene tetrahydromethanopterin reductase-like flavin-dependent oxidoreductase (luciferase family)
MQMAGRTPAATAMTAMTLDSLSSGRFRLGLGVSGPQVVEGWHGQPFGTAARAHARVRLDRPRDHPP